MAEKKALTFEEWLAAYGRAWRECDADAVARLFAEEGVYRSHALRQPHVGREAIRAYWRRAAGPQEALDLRFGEPIVSGRRAAVEWWATYLEEREERTLVGILYLVFDDAGLCRELREAWIEEPGRREPYDGWGR